MDPNTWYFTLSALAQTLSGVLGLTAIFVVVKLEQITKQVDYYKRRGASILKAQSRKEAHGEYLSFNATVIFKKLQAFSHKHRDDPEMLPHLERVLKRYDPSLRATPDRAVRFMDDTVVSLEDNLEQKKNIISKVIIPSILTMLAIFVSLILLAFTDPLLTSFPYTLELLVGVVVLGVFGMYLIAVASYEILWSVE